MGSGAILLSEPLLLSARPYCAMGEPCGVSSTQRIPEVKRYFAVPPHGFHDASSLVAEIARLNGIDCTRFEDTFSLWNELEAATIPAFWAAALQISKPGQQKSGVGAKAYFKPIRMAAAGLHLAAVVLARAVSQVDPEAADYVRHEVLRRDRLRELFYVSVALRPDLQIETYWDCEETTPFTPRQLGNLAMDAFNIPEIAVRAMTVAQAATRRGFLCDHASGNLWPADSREFTLALSVGGAVKREVSRSQTRHIHLDLIRALSAMEGSDTPVPENESDIIIYPELEPSVIAVKIAENQGRVRHKILFEEIDPAFPALL